MITAPYCKISKIVSIILLSLLLLLSQFSFFKYSECHIPVEVYRKALVRFEEKLYGSIDNQSSELKPLNGVAVNYSNPHPIYSSSDPIVTTGDHLMSFSYSFKRTFLDCLGSKYWNMLIQIVFENNVQVIPFDVHFAECVLYKNGRQQAKPNMLRFGVILHQGLNVSLNRLITTPNELCHRIVDKDFCLVLSCKNDVNVHFVRLDDKKDYWMGENCIQQSNYISSRFAVKKFHTQYVPSDQAVFSYPLDTIRFQKHIAYSNLFECNKTLEKYIKSIFTFYYNVSPKMPKSNFESLVKLRDMLHGARMTPMLAGGTLLGWARECGVIPYTHDFDLMVLSDEYNEHFENMISDSVDFYLTFRFNKLNDCLEYTIKGEKKVRIDVFFLYQEETHSYLGGMDVKTKLKFKYPRLKQICSADFLGYLFHIPCNYMEFIVSDYGPGWMVPVHQDDFRYDKISKAVSKLKKLTSAEYDDNFVRFK